MQFLTFITLFAFMFLLTGTVASPLASALEPAVGIETVVPANVLAIAESIPVPKGKAIPGAELQSLCKMVTILHQPDIGFLSAYIFDYQNKLIGLNDHVDVRTRPFYFYSQLIFPVIMYDLSFVPNFYYGGRHEIMYCNARTTWTCTQTFFC